MRTLSIVSILISLVFGILGFISYEKGTATNEYFEQALYNQVYRPFVLVRVHEDEREVRSGSGFLVKHDEDGVCRVFAVTNHHVVYGKESMTDERKPNLGDAVITLELTRQEGEVVAAQHLAEPSRTSKYADLSLLLVPHLSCEDAKVAEIVDKNYKFKILDKVLHVTSSGAEPGNIEVKPGTITRFSPDIENHVTLSTDTVIVSGTSGGPVFVKVGSRYKVVGVVKAHYTLDKINYAGTNYIASAEELRILIGQ